MIIVSPLGRLCFLKIIMKNNNLKFPKDFLWGAATSAYQVEGGIKNDWSLVFDAGLACDHYNRFREDFDLARSLNQNAHRFSIEWSRIEPEEGKFNEKEIEHYRQVIRALRERGIESFVTLWHWTFPLWFSKKGGFEKRKNIKYFLGYVEKVVSSFKNDVNFWLTLNEPEIYSSNSFLTGKWPSQKKSLLSYLKVFMNLVWAHRKAYKIIKKINPQAQVGLAKNNIYFESVNKNPFNYFLKKMADFWWNFLFLNKIWLYLDFIGLNYYYHNRIKGLKFSQNENKEVSDMNWEIYPQGVYYVLKDLKRYKKPVYITENGLADAKDEKREKFIKEHLFWIHKAIEEGIDVRGYFHWSLVDNFEWDKGFWPRFGLIEIDYKTMERKIRPSAYEYAKICKNNELEI